jgi:accessory gene regulator protein AgrB
MARYGGVFETRREGEMVTRSNVGLSRFAQVSLAATALAPVLLVWAAGAYEASRIYAFAAVIASALMVGVCVGLLALARRELQTDPLTVLKASRLDKEAVGFLVAYALPLVVSSEPTKFLALAVFVAIVGLLLVQLQILHVNPLLGALGCR